MSASFKIIAALVLATLMSPLLGIWAIEFVPGGEEGAVNLPSAFSPCSNVQVAVAPRALTSSDNVICRVKYEVPSLDKGLKFVLPSNMSCAVATYSQGVLPMPPILVQEELHISSVDLEQLRSLAIDEFGLTLVDGEGKYLRVVVVFRGNGVDVFVE